MNNMVANNEVQVIRWLAGKDIASSIASSGAVKATMTGFPVSSIQHIAKALSVDPDCVYKLARISARTLQRKAANNALLSYENSDGLYRLFRVFNDTVRTFQSIESAKKWFLRENMALDGDTPINAIRSDAGAEMVEDILGQIRHGIPS